MTLKVVVTPVARGQIRVIGRWWRRNREKARGLFREELAAVTMMLAS